MRVRTQKGTSLVEILVVIVIFLVGILAIVQVFPPGLAVLRTSRNNTMAAQLGEAESQRILGRSGQLPEMIVPVTYIQLSGGGVQVKIDPNRLPSDLMPPRDANQPGRIDANGDVLLGGTRLANWQRVSGANLFTRVIGESTVVPAPRQIPGLNGGFGGVYTMAFGPAYFIPTAQGVGVDGVVSVYGNDYVRLNGNREANRPNPFRSREGEFYFVSGDETDDTNFPGEDQIWVAPSSGRKFRISMSFAYDNSTSVNQFDVILQTDFTNGPTVYGVQAGNYWVISLQKLIAQQDIYGNSNFQESGYRYTDFGSLRLQRVYEEIPIGQAFSANDPYEYKVLGTGQDQGGSGFCLGSLLFNPTGYSTRVRSAQSNNEALLARMDYAVFDWRLIKDEFRVPTSEVVAGRLADKPVKLILNSIKTFRGGPDNRQNTGLGLNTPTIAPLGNGLTDDAVVVDIDTGAVILGNLPGNALSGWWMDKSLGNITFHDVDNDPSNGLSVYMSFPTGDPNNPWGARRFVPDVTRRAVRVMYMGNSEWTVQPIKSARAYRVSRFLGGNGLSPGETYVGGSPDVNGMPVGDTDKLYFPPSDLGQKVVAGEMWLTVTTNNFGTFSLPLYDQELQIVDIQSVNGAQLARADVGKVASDYWRNLHPTDTVQSVVFDASQGYSVRRVRGASLKVRVMWNPSKFNLGADPVKNYEELEVWMRNWRRTESESLQVGGR